MFANPSAKRSATWTARREASSQSNGQICRQQATANSRSLRLLTLRILRRISSIVRGSLASSHSCSVIELPESPPRSRGRPHWPHPVDALSYLRVRGMTTFAGLNIGIPQAGTSRTATAAGAIRKLARGTEQHRLCSHSSAVRTSTASRAGRPGGVVDRAAVALDKGHAHLVRHHSSASTST